MDVQSFLALISDGKMYPDSDVAEGGRIIGDILNVVSQTWFLVVICIVFFVIAMRLFVIGNPADGVSMCCSTSINDQILELQLLSLEYGIALRDWKVERVDRTLFISARKVFISPFFNNADYKTTVDIHEIDSIFFAGKEVWSHKA